MAAIGYARVSSTGQSLEVQTEKLIAAGVEPDHLFAEKRSGTTAKDRPELDAALRSVRKGDVLIVTKMDRLARSVSDLRTIVDKLDAKGVGFRVLDQAAHLDPSAPVLLGLEHPGRAPGRQGGGVEEDFPGRWQRLPERTGISGGGIDQCLVSRRLLSQRAMQQHAAGGDLRDGRPVRPSWPAGAPR